MTRSTSRKSPQWGLEIGADPCDTRIDADHVQFVLAQHQRTARFVLGFPGNLNFDYSHLADALTVLTNNVGDPTSSDASDIGTKPYEREVIEFLAGLFDAGPAESYGYVTSSGTEGNEFGIYTGRVRFPRAAVYYSTQAHYTVPLLAAKLRMPAIEIPAGRDGGMDPAALAAAITRTGADAGAVVVATVGTTMTGASDDVPLLRRAADTACAAVGGDGVHLHVDGALGGLVAALTPGRPPVGFTAGADSISLSGHKIIGCPVPCGVVLALAGHVAPTRTGAYIAATNHTLGCSRSGLAALLLWVALRARGRSGLAEMVAACQDTAAYAHRRLAEAGWRPHRYPGSLIVSFAAPREPWVTRRWHLPVADDRAHLVAVEHVTPRAVDELLADLAATAGPRTAAA